MAIQESHAELKQLSDETSSTVTSCRRNKSDNASFASNLRDHFHDFINTPMENHKACLKTTIRKMLDKLPARNSGPKEGESSSALQKSVEN